MDWTLVIEIITFVVFFILLYRWMHVPIANVLRQRADRIAEEQRVAAEQQRRAAEMQRETQQQIEQARQEARGIIGAANKAAEVQRRALLEQAQRDAEGLSRRARDVIERERQAAIDELRREAGRLAVLAATRVVEHSLEQGDAGRQLADRAIAEVGG